MATSRRSDAGRRIGAVDLLVGGTPCQSFSLAGHRLGLDDPRGNLTLEYLGWLGAFAPAGSFGKTSPESCRLTRGGRLEPSSGRWQNSGTGSLTEFWTLSSSECPSVVVVSSLLDILEGGRLPLRYFLSATACAGILRRAEKRKRSLPPLLRTALERVAAIPKQAQAGHILARRRRRPLRKREVGEARQWAVRKRVPQPRRAHAPRRGIRRDRGWLRQGHPALPVAFSCKDYGADASEDVAPTLRAMGHDESHPNAGGQLAVAFRGCGRTASSRARSRRPWCPPMAATRCRWCSRRGSPATGAAHRTWWRLRSRRSPEHPGAATVRRCWRPGWRCGGLLRASASGCRASPTTGRSSPTTR